jgi:hypothetical protein
LATPGVGVGQGNGHKKWGVGGNQSPDNDTLRATRLSGALGWKGVGTRRPEPAGQAVDVALGVPGPAGSDSRSHGVRRGKAGVSDWGAKSSQGVCSVNFGRPVPWQSYPRSSNDSKMSVSMRSHSMLLWYSNFRVVRLPSSPATRTFAHALPSRNFQVGSWRLGRCTAHVPSVRKQMVPPPAHPAC